MHVVLHIVSCSYLVRCQDMLVAFARCFMHAVRCGEAPPPPRVGVGGSELLLTHKIDWE